MGDLSLTSKAVLLLLLLLRLLQLVLRKATVSAFGSLRTLSNGQVLHHFDPARRTLAAAA
jgi:hypothetical protein